MAKKFRTGLSASGFRRLANEIKEYRQDLDIRCEMFVAKLAMRGVEIAKIEIVSFDAIYTGELIDSISFEQGDVVSNGATYLIYTNCGWAAFNEFGVGILGSERPHPEAAELGWKYDINNHGEKGWFYFKAGQWHWTKGFPSRPFMHNTGQRLRKDIAEIAKGVFGNGE